jgi:hypothetical protein
MDLRERGSLHAVNLSQLNPGATALTVAPGLFSWAANIMMLTTIVFVYNLLSIVDN